MNPPFAPAAILSVAIHCAVILASPSAQAGTDRAIVPFAEIAARDVPADVMQGIYREVQTPHKYGVILRGDADELIDCPNVFRRDGHWYMMYIAIRANTG